MKLEQYLTEAISTGRHKKQYSDLDNLKVGDRVRVKSRKDILDIFCVNEMSEYESYALQIDRPDGGGKDCYFFNPKMLKSCGREFTVEYINMKNGRIKLKEDRSQWTWIIDLLEIL
jgi:hypothetical protein